MKTTQKSLENKKTSELLDMIGSLVDNNGHLQDGYIEVLDELKSRAPFYDIGHDDEGNTVQEAINMLWDEIKKLKRHKHDEKTGDVLIRI